MTRTVIVTGGRAYADASRIESVLVAIDAEERIGLLVHGGARGADSLARMWAASVGITTKEVGVNGRDWLNMGNNAGPIRNARMLDEHRDALVVAFPGGKGTADCVRKARERGMTVVEVTP